VSAPEERCEQAVGLFRVQGTGRRLSEFIGDHVSSISVPGLP
jgi:hypothetical protein